MKVKEAIQLIEKYPKLNAYSQGDIFREADWIEAKKIYDYFLSLFEYELATGWIALFNALCWGKMINWLSKSTQLDFFNRCDLTKFVEKYYSRKTCIKMQGWLNNCVFDEQLKKMIRLHQEKNN